MTPSEYNYEQERKRRAEMTGLELAIAQSHIWEMLLESKTPNSDLDTAPDLCV